MSIPLVSSPTATIIGPPESSLSVAPLPLTIAPSPDVSPLPLPPLPPLLPERFVHDAFAREFDRCLASSPAWSRLTMECLRRAERRYFTCPSSSTGKYHPPDEFSCGLGGDPTRARQGEGPYGGQVLHCRRVALLVRDFCRASRWGDWRQPTETFHLLIAAALVHDMAQCQPGKTYYAADHPLKVRDQTADIPRRFPEDAARWDALMTLIATHSGIWPPPGGREPSGKRESVFHYCDYLASREYFVVDPDHPAGWSAR